MTLSIRNLSVLRTDGTALFSQLNLHLTPGRYALVGANGVGKTRLARAISGLEVPDQGDCSVQGTAVYFSQTAHPPRITASEYLAEIWEISDPVSVRVRDQFLETIALERLCSELSGGTWVKVRLLHLLCTPADWIILDEPTNHLDQEGQETVRTFIRESTASILIISHDRELLREADEILELSNQGLSHYGMSWDEYAQERNQERERQESRVQESERLIRKTRRDRQSQLNRLKKKQANARRNSASAGLPKILLGARKRRAESTLGKKQKQTKNELLQATEHSSTLRKKNKIDPKIYADLSSIKPSASQLVFDAVEFNFRYPGSAQPLWKNPISIRVSGSDRLQIRGPNGSGKTTLLKLLTDDASMPGERYGMLRLGRIPYAYLDQELRLPGVSPELSVTQAFIQSTDLGEIEARNRLASFLFAGEHALQPIAHLSGGERVRLSLAIALSQAEKPGLLILDEPTHHLDLQNIEFLEELLGSYTGALVILSHDGDFIESIGITRTLDLKTQETA